MEVNSLGLVEVESSLLQEEEEEKGESLHFLQVGEGLGEVNRVVWEIQIELVVEQGEEGEVAPVQEVEHLCHVVKGRVEQFDDLQGGVVTGWEREWEKG